MTAAPKVSRYARRVLDLAAEDPQLQELMPDHAVLEAVTRTGATLQGIVDTILSGYAERPALGARDYAVGVDGATGLQIRRLQPTFGTVTSWRSRTSPASAASPQNWSRTAPS